ncbi:MAG: hypothetical protein HQM01_09505 [Magnetococcales bacterium]|nr:hypothetical protein [Magnetococcales bacterium]
MSTTGSLLNVKISVLSLVALMISGCAVPDHMEVRTDIDPANEDKQVRFRSTHYYRVVDMCNNSPIYVHALYRFKMSGKTGALGNTVNFESGTLKAHQIDPFGADITFDAANKRFTYNDNRVPTTESEICKTNLATNQAMVTYLRSVCTSNEPTEKAKENALADIDLLTKCLKKEIGKRVQANILKVIEGMTPCINDDSNPGSDNDEVLCPDGKQPSRGFQVFGPEGWRTFNQNDRLILAMYSDGQPLINTLKTVSQAILDGKNSSDIPKNSVLKEKLRLSDAKWQVKEFKDSSETKPLDEFWTNLLLTFNPSEEQPH